MLTPSFFAETKSSLTVFLKKVKKKIQKFAEQLIICK
jgi:hypothetical protein